MALAGALTTPRASTTFKLYPMKKLTPTEPRPSLEHLRQRPHRSVDSCVRSNSPSTSMRGQQVWPRVKWRKKTMMKHMRSRRGLHNIGKRFRQSNLTENAMPGCNANNQMKAGQGGKLQGFEPGNGIILINKADFSGNVKSSSFWNQSRATTSNGSEVKSIYGRASVPQLDHGLFSVICCDSSVAIQAQYNIETPIFNKDFWYGSDSAEAHTHGTSLCLLQPSPFSNLFGVNITLGGVPCARTLYSIRIYVGTDLEGGRCLSGISSSSHLALQIKVSA